MAFELGKLNRFAPLVGVYAFYSVFATHYPTDPIGGMRTALTNFVSKLSDPIAYFQTKSQNIVTLAIVILGVPLLLRSIKLPAAVKMIANLAVYYIIGDQVAALINGTGKFGATYGYIMPGQTWGGEQSAYHQPGISSGTIKNTFGGN